MINETITYDDKMGNIRTLQRQGNLNGVDSYGLMDNLTCTYTGNRLTKVTDAVTTPITYQGAFHFVDRANVANEYTYDDNGNLTKDLNRNIISITYNELNLPNVITFSGNRSIIYGYDAAGNKLSVAYLSDGEPSKMEYVGNRVYNNNMMTTLLTDEGYIDTGTTPVYHYYLKDHQGNNRVVVNQAGTVEEVNHYYPFGGVFSELARPSIQRYKYNGKELDRKFDLDMYDYGARHYDPVLGRWFTVDPMAEKYYSISPYVYVANNPVRLIDPNGMEIDLSDMSEEEQEAYNALMRIIREKSQLFNEMYSSLESSDNVFKVIYGKTVTTDNQPALGIFAPNKGGGGTITFLEGTLNIGIGTLAEEYFHAYQHENKSKYDSGEFNFEFEAKVVATAIMSESDSGWGPFEGMVKFQDKIGFGDYGKDSMLITPTNVMSKEFLNDYYESAGNYKKYNINNNIGNSHYRKSTTVAPFSLQQLIKKTYGK